MDGFEDRAPQALANPRNVGEMEETDAVGTTGSADHGGMLRMWLKFTEKDGRLVIDRDSFQPFGGQTAIAVASIRIVPLDEEEKHPKEADFRTSQ